MNTSRFSQKRYLGMGWNRPGVDAGLRDVPDSRSLHDVPDHELLDGLVLGAGLGAVGAPDELDMAPAMLVTSIVTSLGCHLCNINTR